MYQYFYLTMIVATILAGLIRPNETLDAKLEIFDFNDFDGEYPENDVDGDGYLDIMFTIHPQKDETSVMTSTKDVYSEIYKLKAG